jgi:RNA polymerase sigma factor (TIGR02999 family)
LLNPKSQGRAMSDVTQILGQIESGDGQAAEKLLPLVYDELRKLAAAKMAKEDPGQTLQATALVHEAYIRLVDVDKAQHWNSRGHFFGAAAEAMRRILVETARQKGHVKHGGGMGRAASLDNIAASSGLGLDDVLAVDDAISRLEAVDPQVAKLVQLRFFAGLNFAEAGQTLGVSAVTARRYWRYARAWLHRQLQTD